VADRGRTVMQAARDHEVSWPVVAAAFTDPPNGWSRRTPIRYECWVSTRSAGGRPRWVLDEATSTWQTNGAYYPRIRMDDGYDVIVAHVQPPVVVQVGQRVYAGQPVANVGSEGASTGCHLHFEVRPAAGGYRTSVDPHPWLGPKGWSAPIHSGPDGHNASLTSSSTSTGPPEHSRDRLPRQPVRRQPRAVAAAGAARSQRAPAVADMAALGPAMTSAQDPLLREELEELVETMWKALNDAKRLAILYARRTGPHTVTALRTGRLR
jgi:hypothetical protein